MRINRILIFISIVTCVIMACEKIMPPEPDAKDILAGPIEDLTAAQMSMHLAGDVEFGRIFSEKDGLGPVFVQTSCENCHAGDGKGSPFNNLTRFGNYNSDGSWNPRLDIGGPQLQHRSIDRYDPETLPQGVESSDFIAPNVTGLGYFGALTDETILAMEDPLDADGNGISGVANYLDAPDWLNPDSRYHSSQYGGKYIGRFGRKASAIDLLHQTVNAYVQDMGITSIFEMNDPVNYFTSVVTADKVADPEIPATTVNEVVFYLQTLKAPERRNTDNEEVIAGEKIFEALNCNLCHVATLKTGPSEITALDRVEFHPYTDLLLHDMGRQLDDNYTEGSATTSEWRTTPLWGLGLQKDSQGGVLFLMHDGRASNYEQAIQLHGGEAAASRDMYHRLSENEKGRLIRFLESL